jgi:hypothetical protein
MDSVHIAISARLAHGDLVAADGALEAGRSDDGVTDLELNCPGLPEGNLLKDIAVPKGETGARILTRPSSQAFVRQTDLWRTDRTAQTTRTNRTSESRRRQTTILVQKQRLLGGTAFGLTMAAHIICPRAPAQPMTRAAPSRESETSQTRAPEKAPGAKPEAFFTQPLLPQRGHARQFFAFQPFQKGAAGRGDVAEIVADAGIVQGRDGVAAAGDR